MTTKKLPACVIDIVAIDKTTIGQLETVTGAAIALLDFDGSATGSYRGEMMARFGEAVFELRKTLEAISDYAHDIEQTFARCDETTALPIREGAAFSAAPISETANDDDDNPRKYVPDPRDTIKMATSARKVLARLVGAAILSHDPSASQPRRGSMKKFVKLARDLEEHLEAIESELHAQGRAADAEDADAEAAAEAAVVKPVAEGATE